MGIYRMKKNGKYTVYGDNGKVVIITSDSRLAKDTEAKLKKGKTNNG